MNLICTNCGENYQKPDKFKIWNDEHFEKYGRYNIHLKMSMQYCDVCRVIQEIKMLNRLPEIITILSK